MKISVITVCYNSHKTVARALKSIVDQDWKDTELLVVDGGSTDGTGEILKRFSDDIDYMVCEPDRGIYDAMNKGLKHATGDVVCFLNSDDKYAIPTVLTLVASRMQEEGLDALLGDVAFFRAACEDKFIRRYRSDRFTPEKLASGWMPAHPALFLRREIFERVGNFNISYRIAGDFEFIARAFSQMNLRYSHVPEVLVHMQSGGVSTSGLGAKVKLNMEVLRACRENGIDTNIFKLMGKYPLKVLEMFNR